RRRRQCCCPSQGRSTGTTLLAPRPRRGRIRRPLRSAGGQVGGGDQAAAAPVVGGRGGVEAAGERQLLVVQVEQARVGEQFQPHRFQAGVVLPGGLAHLATGVGESARGQG